jgi:hypothetical protein
MWCSLIIALTVQDMEDSAISRSVCTAPRMQVSQFDSSTACGAERDTTDVTASCRGSDLFTLFVESHTF